MSYIYAPCRPCCDEGGGSVYPPPTKFHTYVNLYKFRPSTGAAITRAEWVRQIQAGFTNVNTDYLGMDVSNNLYFGNSWQAGFTGGIALAGITPAGANLFQTSNINYVHPYSLKASYSEDNMIFTINDSKRYNTFAPYASAAAPLGSFGVLFDDGAAEITLFIYHVPNYLRIHQYGATLIRKLNRATMTINSEVVKIWAQNDLYIPSAVYKARNKTSVGRDTNGNYNLIHAFAGVPGANQQLFFNVIEATTGNQIIPIKYLPIGEFPLNSVALWPERVVKDGKIWLFSSLVNNPQRVYRLHKFDSNYDLSSAHNIAVEFRNIGGQNYQNIPVQMVIDPNESAFYIMWELPENYPLPYSGATSRVHMLVKYDGDANELWRYKFTSGAPYFGIFPNQINRNMFENYITGPTVPMCISKTGEIYFEQRSTMGQFNEV